PLHQERGVGDVVRQRVLEHVGELGIEVALEDQLERGQLAQKALGTLPHLREAVDEAARELATDDGRELKRSLGRFGETIDPRGDDVLDGSGNDNLAEGARELL